ncbi:MAG: hypothetical protein BHW33_01880 [Firmicutes bacterium CAG:137_57_8]|nr:MAG: hypothetical protein BHW33_01880 [Firmicutes bacterium CAG:137_57_8]
MITGHYGSGKTEYAVNLALRLAAEGKKTVLADLDIVNPYFRSYEQTKLLSVFQDRSWTGVLDIGGDPIGARVLARFAPQIQGEEFELLYVLNANRPETRNVDRALAYMQGIEAECRQKVTGIVNNTHLCGETTAAEILKGADLAGQLSRQTGLPVVCHAVERRLVPQVENTLIEPILPMDLYMKKPWEITTCEEEHLLWPEP